MKEKVIRSFSCSYTTVEILQKEKVQVNCNLIKEERIITCESLIKGTKAVKR